MKKTAIIILALLVNTVCVLASDKDSLLQSTNNTDILVASRAVVIEGSGYFSVKMLNESAPYVYILIKDTGTDSEIIATKNGVPNNINQAVLYSFSVPYMSEAEYRLVQVGAEYKVISIWTYDSISKVLREVPVNNPNLVQK